MKFKWLAITLLCLSSSITLAEKQALKNEDWLLSLEKRVLLSFITECALRKDQMLAIENSGVIFEYYGKLGVAPNWNGYPSSLTVEEQRWVTACVLARVNYFGTPVPFNLRTESDATFQLDITESELNNFPYHEGGFFGNIFENPPKKYACRGDAPTKVLVGKNRICTLPSLKDKGVSECGFRVVGNCDDKELRIRDGIRYKEIFHVWLRMH